MTTVFSKMVLISGINYRYDNRFLEVVLITDIHCTNLSGKWAITKYSKYFVGLVIILFPNL